ncbi:hypothetical protein [Microtetraspora fusca]|uniref:Uncharacterized protein n=1 Tax=Microtetraspora fusca TaxID=1997 RepID=A0ABW6VCG0_MICFU|nr:hypothetical protein [Microtetraspora fusca]
MDDDLPALVRSYLDEDLLVNPDQGRAETEANTLWIGLPDGGFDAGAVRAALIHVGAGLRERFGSREGPPAFPLTFYAWHDEQAGQLRMSMRSAPPDGLPFGARHRPVCEPDEVLASALADTSPGSVRWEELRPDDASPETGDDAWPPFPVYVVAIRGESETPSGRR